MVTSEAGSAEATLPLDDLDLPGSSTTFDDLEAAAREKEYNKLTYKVFAASLYRLADFFSVRSLTYNCKDKVAQTEISVIGLVELSRKELNVTQTSTVMADLLALSHPVFWACSYAFETEISQSSTYVEFTSVPKVL